MSKPNDSRSRHTQSRLGRGLGNLIPVPLREATPASSMPTTAANSGHSTKSKELSRGARAAVGEPKATIIERSPRGAEEPRIEFISLSSLRSGKYQPRSSFDTAATRALAASIETAGLMQPLVVRPIEDGRGLYEVIAGERRWRALELLERTEAPVVVRRVGDQQAAERALIENLQREDLNPMDRAAALRRLTDEFGLTHQQAAQQVGLDRASVTNLLRLNDLDPQTAELVRSGALSAGHAKILVGISDVSQRLQLALEAVREGWSVRSLEGAPRSLPGVPRGTSSPSSPKASTGAHVARLEKDLQAYLGTRVSVKLGRKKGVGELRVHFFSLDEFDGLMQRIGFRDGEARLVV